MAVRELWRAGKTISEIARLRDATAKRCAVWSRGGAWAACRASRELQTGSVSGLLAAAIAAAQGEQRRGPLDEIRARGYSGGRSILWEFLHPLRSLLEDRTTIPFETPPGKQAQADWGTFRKPARKKVQAFVLTLGWSRAGFVDFSDTQALPALLSSHEHALDYLGGVRQEILYDRMKTVWLRDDHQGDPVFHPALLDLAQHYGFRAIALRTKTQPRGEEP